VGRISTHLRNKLLAGLLAAIPVAVTLHFIHPVKIHFPPIPPNS
jgi:uncharacterized membrane protein